MQKQLNVDSTRNEICCSLDEARGDGGWVKNANGISGMLASFVWLWCFQQIGLPCRCTV